LSRDAKTADILKVFAECDVVPSPVVGVLTGMFRTSSRFTFTTVLLLAEREHATDRYHPPSPVLPLTLWLAPIVKNHSHQETHPRVAHWSAWLHSRRLGRFSGTEPTVPVAMER